MANPVNKIERITAISTGPPAEYTPHGTDVFTFDAFLQSAPVKRPTKEVRVLQREGVDGSILVELGVHSKPFTIVTQRFFATSIDPLAILANYQGMIGVDFGVAVTQRGLLYWPCDVMQVDLLSDVPGSRLNTYGPVSGFLSASREITCAWTLLARDVT